MQPPQNTREFRRKPHKGSETDLGGGAETDVDAAISRQRSFDSDLWVIEVEDAKGRHLLEEDGLA
jgi:hypothetical protein